MYVVLVTVVFAAEVYRTVEVCGVRVPDTDNDVPPPERSHSFEAAWRVWLALMVRTLDTVTLPDPVAVVVAVVDPSPNFRL